MFYHCVRPWFCGQVSDSAERMWKFEGIDKCQDGLEEPTNVSGPSAKQTALIHALDIFARTLQRRMQIYMARHHRTFLRHLSTNPRPMRDLVHTKTPELVEAYNQAVGVVKAFRDAHIRFVALYIVGPASRERVGGTRTERFLKGNAGTQSVRLLKGARDKSADELLRSQINSIAVDRPSFEILSPWVAPTVL